MNTTSYTMKQEWLPQKQIYIDNDDGNNNINNDKEQDSSKHLE